MTALRVKTFSFVGAAVALAFGLSACVSPRYPVRAPEPAPPAPVQPAPQPPPPPPPPPPPRDPELPRPAPSTPVQSAPLPPVGQGGASRFTPAAPAPRPAAAAPVPAAPWVQPAAAAQTPGQVVVGRGETLFDVAERVRTPVRAIIELNRLQPPYAVTPGTVLRIPAPLFYTVGQGDTLFGIARRFNIDVRSLANLNDIQMEAPIRPGQRLALPSLARDEGANPLAGSASPPGAAPADVAVAQPPRPVRPPTAPGAALPPSAAAPPAPLPPVAELPSDNQVAAAGRGRFAWPLRGELLSGYGPKGPGQRNDGLNIAAAAGTPVQAAAGGEVVFAGELPGFGNLVLLKHPGGFVTAYAHLAKIAVKMRQTLAQGQEVGQAGQTGMVDRPQLHFEIRYAANPRDKATPVDPAMLLPGAG
jgi:murein DD-endopeptidase MepM/ murein hydrolase activator NlpD